MRRVVVCLCALVGVSILVQPQQVPPNAPIHKVIQQQERELNPPPLPPRAPRQVDPAEVKRDADELARLAQSIPTGVGQAEKGVRPKELGQNLKRIEKLSKRLRSELSL